MTPSSTDATNPKSPNDDLVALQRLDERKFLHDIAGPIGAALLSADIALETVREQAISAVAPDIETIFKALEQVTKMIRERREVLIHASQVKP